jgi:Lon protease-like protein
LKDTKKIYLFIWTLTTLDDMKLLLANDSCTSCLLQLLAVAILSSSSSHTTAWAFVSSSQRLQHNPPWYQHHHHHQPSTTRSIPLQIVDRRSSHQQPFHIIMQLVQRNGRNDRCIRTVHQLAARDDTDNDENYDDDDDDDEEDDMNNLEPLADGINSVAWLPSVKGAKATATTTTTATTISSSDITTPGAQLIPLFPLGGLVYTPNSQHTLNIFEPRYREMYTDILMNGTKRFAVVMSHPTESGRFAQMAVLFELEDLKEVSERTADQIKYICSHRVTGRVKLHRVLNPHDWESRATYLRAEGTLIDDSGKDVTTTSASVSESPSTVNNNTEDDAEQTLLRSSFAKLVELQHELEEDVRFTRASVLTLAVQPGSASDGLWQTIKLWQSFADQRLMSRQNELQQDFQEKLQNYLKKEKGLKGELPR